MGINVITTIDIDEEEMTRGVLNRVYEEFRGIIKTAHESGDLTNFLFVNTDTEFEIENEVKEE